jgi:hypothetical protein
MVSQEQMIGKIALPFFLLLALTVVRGGESGPGTIRFNRDVRPIVAKSCVVCHDPESDQRQAGGRRLGTLGQDRRIPALRWRLSHLARSLATGGEVSRGKLEYSAVA